MLIGDFLYGLSRTEARSSPVIQRSIGQLSTSLANAVVTTDGPIIPADKIFVLTNAAMQFVGGGAQTVTSWDLIVLDEAGNNLADIAGDVGTAANQRRHNLIGMGFLLMSRERFRLRGFYSAGAIANIAAIGFHGFYLPRGNLQLR